MFVGSPLTQLCKFPASPLPLWLLSHVEPGPALWAWHSWPVLKFVQEIKAAAAEKDGKKAEVPEETPVREVQETRESEEGYKPGKLT